MAALLSGVSLKSAAASAAIKKTAPEPLNEKKKSGLLDEIAQGVQLKDSSRRVLAPRKEAANAPWLTFNVDKIVARRAYLEVSDDEEDEKWEDDDWD